MTRPALAAMNIHRLETKIAADADGPGRSAIAEMLGRLAQLERRVATLERRSPQAASASSASATQPMAPPGKAHGTATESAAFPARTEGAANPSASDAPKTQRLARVPVQIAPAENPLPDLSLLEQKLEPAKPPVQRVAVRAAIEDFPRITQRIQQLWGTPECEQYLNALIIDNRGHRQGFPPAVLEELLYLARLARMLVILQVGGDLWASYDHVGDRR